jgi:hypothetical protein
MQFFDGMKRAATGAADQAALPREGRHLIICHFDHANDRTYAENLTEFLTERQVPHKVVVMRSESQGPELEQCLRDDVSCVLGYNSQLDHAWLDSTRFIEAAAARNLPVIQWLLDHPSVRWPEFERSTLANCRFLFNSEFCRRYFQQYCLPSSVGAAVVGVGPNHHSRVDALTAASFSARLIKCVLPINLKRVGKTLHDLTTMRLGDDLEKAITGAVERARHDLDGPLERHLLETLGERGARLSNDSFNACFQVVSEEVQTQRRIHVLTVARDYPAQIQSDSSACNIAERGRASFVAGVSMPSTLARMRSACAVVSVSPLNDEIHDRTLNGLNAGCVNIVEDNAIHRRVFEHGRDALLFRYGDDSLRECLDIVCYQPKRAYEIAQAGFALRDDPRFRFGGYGAILDLAQYTPAASGRS